MDFETCTSYIKSITAKYPLAELSTCGKSHLKKELYSLSLGRGTNYVLYIGGACGRDFLSPLLLLKFYENLCEKYAKGKELAGIPVREMLYDRRLIIIPEINPDGIEIALKGESATGEYKSVCKAASKGDYSYWNANARGVDINYNFNVNWETLHDMEVMKGASFPSPLYYGGEHAESENETKALVRLCKKLPIRHAIAFHSQDAGIYWKYGENTPTKSHLMAKIFAAITNYNLATDKAPASHGGFKDWFISEFSRPAFNVGIGKDVNLLSTEFENIYKKLEEMLCVGIIM